MSAFSKLILITFCFNVAMFIIQGAGYSSSTHTQYLPIIGVYQSSMLDTFSITAISGMVVGAIAAYYTGNSNFLFVFIAWAALAALFPVLNTLVLGFWYLLQSFGLPSYWVIGLSSIYGLIFFFFGLHIATGRETEPN